ncbi:cytochrome P450 [Trichoderma cornu-damae]|uniref:Cytochrome P450 monooxygenase ABA1 n=1 Tax=Trichoderma cornu-damae TaxID=654480 RepID=A0A9P8TZK3_9HYPO|nr:cytochrome P450 [Trichoderma cornu-damae]
MEGFAQVPGYVVLLAGCLFSFFAVGRITAYARLRKFDGPLLTNFTNWPHRKALFQKRCHEWYGEVCEKYGPITRIAPNVLITSSPDVWARVNNKPGYKRSKWYYTACRIEHRRDNVFTETDNEKHEVRRKRMAPGYSGRENLDLESSIDRHVQGFLDLIRSKYVSTSAKIVPMDLAQKVQFFTLDVISGVGLGKAFGMLQSDSDVEGYVLCSEEGLETLNYGMALGLNWVAQTPFIGRFISPSPKDSKGFGRMMATCFRYVNERVAHPTDKRSDMLASFIRHGIEGDELRSEALEQIIAGSDTTSTGIRGTLLHIITNPRVYAKLQKEVDEAVRDGRAPGDGLITHSQAKQLPYLQATIREALRVLPPVSNLLSRDIPPGGDTVRVNGKDVFLPGGASIGYSAFAMHRSTEIYGSDAKAFRPERWFDDDKDKLAVMLRASDMIFGHGKYQCLGKPVAQIEFGKMLRNFDIALMNPAKPWVASNHLGLFSISDMWVQDSGLVKIRFLIAHANVKSSPLHDTLSSEVQVKVVGGRLAELFHPVTMSSALARGSSAQATDSTAKTTVAPVPTFDSAVSKGVSLGRVAVLLGLLTARFNDLVAEPALALQSSLPIVAAVQVVYAVLCLPAAGSQQAKAAKKPRPGEKKRPEAAGTSSVVTALLALVLATISTPVIHVLFVIFGAPFLDFIPQTFLCAAHFSLLGVFPVIYARGVDSQALIAVAGVSAPLDETLGGLLGAVLGAWLGAVPIPLDWDREWQKWPVTVVCGLYAGSCLGSWLSGAVFYGKQLGGTASAAGDE